jgi:hypothetical protein
VKHRGTAYLASGKYELWDATPRPEKHWEMVHWTYNAGLGAVVTLHVSARTGGCRLEVVNAEQADFGIVQHDECIVVVRSHRTLRQVDVNFAVLCGRTELPF